LQGRPLIITGGARRPECGALPAMPRAFTHDAATRRALTQMNRAIARGDLAAAERWLSAAERCLAIAERAAGLAQLSPHPHRAHARTPWRPPPPPPPPPPPKRNPPAPGDDELIRQALARQRLALCEKLFIVPHENRPPRHRTPPAGKTTP